MELEIIILKLYRMNNGPANGKSMLRAYVDLMVNKTFIIHGFRLVESARNANHVLFLAPPRELNKHNQWYDTVRFIDDGVLKEIEKKVIDAYNTEINCNVKVKYEPRNMSLGSLE